MKRNKNDFFRELADLLTRYPSPEWARLAALLEDRKTRSELIRFLRGITKLLSANDDTPRTTDQRSASGITKKPSRNKKKERADRLELELSRRSISELRELARAHGLYFSPKDSKQRLISRVLKRSLGKKIDTRRPERRKEDPSDYVQWADIIMGRGKKHRAP